MVVWLLIVIAVLLLVIVALYRAKLPLPLMDHGSAVFTIRDEFDWRNLLSGLNQAGFSPRYRTDEGDFHRAFMADNATIINCVGAEVHPGLTGIYAGKVVLCKDPRADAAKLATSLGIDRYAYEIIDNAETGTPAGNLVLVTSDAFPGLFFGFRRHALKMGGQRPKRWSWTK